MSEKALKYPFLELETVNKPYNEALRTAACRVIDSGRYIGGMEVDEFNSELAALCQAPHAIGVSNGLDALRLILEAYKLMDKLHDGDEVIVPANTFIASVLAITHAGLTPVLVDPDPHTMVLSAQGIEQAMTPHTKAIMPVHLYGRIAWDADIALLASQHNLLVVEDAAQAIGAMAATPGLFGSRMAAAIGHAGAFSFYPTKNIGALGDAGAIVTHDAALAQTVKALANYGSDTRYHNIYTGYNCRLDPMQAALLRVKLADTQAQNARRFERAVAYNNVISHPKVIKPIISREVTDCVWHQYVIRVSGNRRDDMRHYLMQNGVGTDIHYPLPPHMQPCYAALHHRPLPITEQLAGEVLSLPITDCTTVNDAAEIGRIINKFK